MTPRPPLRISVSGVRGVAGEALTPGIVTSFAAAFGTYVGAGPVAIGTDTRPSREMVSQAALAGLLSVGCTPVDLGIVPVPALQHFVRGAKAVGGICATASHHTAEWNALKFFDKEGMVLRPNQFTELLDLYHQDVYSRVGADGITEVVEDGSAAERHREAILGAVDAESIRARRLRVAVDACNGAASTAVGEFLTALGCEVEQLHVDPEAEFPRTPEPTPASLSDLSRRVRESSVDIGFALDADADRLVVVDETGKALDEDFTIALVANYVLRRDPGPLVVNLTTSSMLDDIAAEIGCEVHRTKVGESHVVEHMLECGARLGGEGNGGVIDLRLNPCRDSFVGMAWLLEALAAERGTVSELCGRFPQYHRVKRELSCRPRDIAPWIKLLRFLFREQELDLTDGIKILWPDRWLHVRGSNTESIVRITAESRKERHAKALVKSVFDYLRPRV